MLYNSILTFYLYIYLYQVCFSQVGKVFVITALTVIVLHFHYYHLSITTVILLAYPHWGTYIFMHLCTLTIDDISVKRQYPTSLEDWSQPLAILITKFHFFFNCSQCFLFFGLTWYVEIRWLIDNNIWSWYYSLKTRVEWLQLLRFII